MLKHGEAQSASIVETASRISETASQMAGHDQRSIGEPRVQINVNDSLQSWLDVDNINVNALFPESFSCVISGPSEC